MVYRIFIIYLFMIFTLPTWADVKESLSQSTVRVGDEVELKLQFSPQDVVEWKLPSKGFLNKEGDEDLPYAEITEITKGDRELKIKVIYFEPGEFVIPVSWFDKDDYENRSQKIITVKSVLQGEKDLLDIKEPIRFSGPYILRLVLLILGIAIVIAAILFGISYYKNKFIRPIDAIIETESGTHRYYLDKINGILDSLHTEIRHKDFIYILSGYIKEIISNQTGTFVQYMSQEEINGILKKRYNFSQNQLLELTNYFDSIKYMPNDEMISQRKAVELVMYWRKLLRV